MRTMDLVLAFLIYLLATIVTTTLGIAQENVWLSLFPGLAIVVTVLDFNLLGDGLRDAFDPRLK